MSKTNQQQLKDFVLPPIITNSSDREFLTSLNDNIQQELLKFEEEDTEQIYTVYKSAFDDVINYVTAYKPILTSIKAEYETCIDTILQGERQAQYLSGKLLSMATEATTVQNYKKRLSDLHDKIQIIETNNEKLRQKISHVKCEREQLESLSKEVVQQDEEDATTVSSSPLKVPGMNLAHATDTRFLTTFLDKIERQLKEMNLTRRTRYSPAETRDSLKQQLQDKVLTRDQLSDVNLILKAKNAKLKIVTEAAEAYLELRPPHQTIGDALVSALLRASGKISLNKDVPDPSGQQSLAGGQEQDRDPDSEKEAELMLDYIERFNELMEDFRYEEAATHAANSPKGILCTPETFHRFQEIEEYSKSGFKSPVLVFTEAVMSTIEVFGSVPNEHLSMLFVRCALDNSRLDLLSHWVAQNKLTISENLADSIFNFCRCSNQCLCGCLAMAQKFYTQLRLHKQVMICMLGQDRIKQLFSYAHNQAELDQTGFNQLLYMRPTARYVQVLVEKIEAGESVLPLGVILTTLLDTEKPELGLHMIQEMYLCGPKNKTRQSTGSKTSTNTSESMQSEVGAPSATADVSSIQMAVFQDEVTTQEEWDEIRLRLQDAGYACAADELHAAVQLKLTLCSATQNVSRLRAASPITPESTLDLDEA